MCYTGAHGVATRSGEDSMTTFKAKVSEKFLLGGSFQYIRLELVTPNRIEFQAGQYIILAVDAIRGIRRNYSITSSPSMNHALDLLVDVKPHGDGSNYLANLSPGDNIEFSGPFGSFIIPPSDPHSELLFVATGSGISPIRNMIINELVDLKSQKQMRLWWGMRHENDCFWTQDFDDLEKEHPNFEWDLVLSKPPEDWPLHSGYITNYILDYVKTSDKKNVCVYLCGSRQMIEDVSTGLIKLGIINDQIRYEKFF